jgi:hypothetical protein
MCNNVYYVASVRWFKITLQGEFIVAGINILKTDSRGRITLPEPFRKEPLFEYMVEGDQIILFPVKTVRKYPDMADLPESELPKRWVAEEHRVNTDSRRGVKAVSPSDALKKKK